MAWFSNLAGKAEDLLIRLDHNASIVLLQNESKENIKNLSSEESDNNLTNVSIISQNSSENLKSEQNNFITYFKDDPKQLNGTETDKNIDISNINNDSIKIQVSNADMDDFNLTTSKDKSNIETKLKILEKKITHLESKYTKSQINSIELKKVIADYEGKNSILQNRLEQTLSALSLTQEELEKYRKKAQKILEDKERLLAQIENSPVANNANEPIEYISKLMKNRDDQQKTVDELNEKLELVQNDLAATQKQCSLLKEEALSARHALIKEEKIRMTLEDDLSQSKQELNKVYEDLKKQISLINLKQEEISSLQKQFDTRSTSSDNEELETKFHTLTKTLIMKQNSLETVTTERNALRLQLEKIEKDYSRIQMELNSKQTSSVLNIDNYEEGRTPSFFTMSPFDEGVTKRVKRAISTINTFSIRLGVFLRRYPVARVFLLCYMILLQIWVVVILFAYVPSS